MHFSWHFGLLDSHYNGPLSSVHIILGVFVAHNSKLLYILPTNQFKRHMNHIVMFIIATPPLQVPVFCITSLVAMTKYLIENNLRKFIFTLNLWIHYTIEHMSIR